MIKIENKKRGRPATGRANKSLTLTISNELHEKVQNYALMQERSISFITKKALEFYLNHENKRNNN